MKANGVIFLWALTTVASPSDAAASGREQIAKIIDEMALECVVYAFTDTRERALLNSEVAVWVVFNEGPTDVVIFASNGATAGVFEPFKGELDLFAGDVRFSYSLGLASQGHSRVYVCTEG